MLNIVNKFLTPKPTSTSTSTLNYISILENLCKNKEYIKNYGLIDTDTKIEKCEISPLNYEIGPTQFASGTFNNVFVINNNNEYVFRKFERGNNLDLDNELNGLFIQKYLSYDCDYICKVNEFGYIKDIVNKKLKISSIYGVIEKVDTDLDKYYTNTKNRLTDTNYDTYIQIFYDILNGLKCIHTAGYVHLDIKPNNIGLVKEIDKMKVKILDFGSLKICKQGECQNNGQKDGTVIYMSPYYITTSIYDSNCDIYAFGMIVYEIYNYNKKYFDDKEPVKEYWKDIINKSIYPITFDILSTLKPFETTNIETYKRMLNYHLNSNNINNNKIKIQDLQTLFHKKGGKLRKHRRTSCRSKSSRTTRRFRKKNNRDTLRK